MAWNLGAQNGRKYASSSWCSLEIRTDARSLLYLAVYSLSLSLFPLVSLSLFLSGRPCNNANVSSETRSKEEFEFSRTDRKKTELQLRSKIV